MSRLSFRLRHRRHVLTEMRHLSGEWVQKKLAQLRGTEYITPMVAVKETETEVTMAQYDDRW